MEHCPYCGADDIEVLQAHPWQDLAGPDPDGYYSVRAEGEDLECRCTSCGGIFWVPGRRFTYTY